MIIILERDKITHKIRNKLLKKGLSLIGISDTEIIFAKLKRHFVWFSKLVLILLNEIWVNQFTRIPKLVFVSTGKIGSIYD